MFSMGKRARDGVRKRLFGAGDGGDAAAGRAAEALLRISAVAALPPAADDVVRAAARVFLRSGKRFPRRRGNCSEWDPRVTFNDA